MSACACLLISAALMGALFAVGRRFMHVRGVRNLQQEVGAGGASGYAEGIVAVRQYLAEVTQLSYDCQQAVAIETAAGSIAWCNSVLPIPSAGCSFHSMWHVDTRDDAAERYFAQAGCEVFEYSPVVWGTIGWKELYGKGINFVKIGLADQQGSIPGIGALDTLENNLMHFPQVQATGWRALRIDALGTEWRALAAAPGSALEGLGILVVRLYMVAAEGEDLLEQLPARLALLRRLKGMFLVYHARSSDCSEAGRRPVPGGEPSEHMPVYTELSMVRRTLVAGTPVGPFSPHSELDRCEADVLRQLPLYPLLPAES